MSLEERVRSLLPESETKRMFGRTGFLVEGSLACSVSESGLLVRVGHDAQEGLLGDGVTIMTMASRPSRGWVEVEPRVVAAGDALRVWVERGVQAARAARR